MTAQRSIEPKVEKVSSSLDTKSRDDDQEGQAASAGSEAKLRMSESTA